MIVERKESKAHDSLFHPSEVAVSFRGWDSDPCSRPSLPADTAWAGEQRSLPLNECNRGYAVPLRPTAGLSRFWLKWLRVQGVRPRVLDCRQEVG